MIDLRINGLDLLLRRLNTPGVPRLLNNIIRKSILLIERNQKIETPVDTGLLRNSYEREFTQSEFSGMIWNSRDYGYIINEGTGRGQINNFFDRGIIRSQDGINNIIDNELDNFINNF